MSSKNHPLDETIAFYERKAIGGAATVTVGSTTPDSKRGMAGDSHLCLDDPTSIHPFSRLASAINRHGAVATIELWHTGANSYICAKRGNQIYGAVDGLNALGQFVPAMPENIIEETIEAFANAAAYAKFCGFGMVIIHAGHGWLLNQFLDPAVNNRKDQWGGSLENRCRLPLAIIDRIRKKCGRGFPIDIRISGSMCYEGGYDIDEGVAIAKQLDGKVDLINVSAGSHEVPEVFTVTHPSMFLPDGVNVIYAAEIKKHIKTPVSTVGSLDNPELMEEILASGKADVVMAARALLADPDLPKKARAGKNEEIRPCLRCFQCFAGVTTKRLDMCAVNPEIGSEQACRHELPSAARKTILVVGGGVAGMQAARTACERGHKVVLCEKNERLGGVLRCEEKVPFKRHLNDYLNYQARMITRLPIDIQMNTVATPEFASAVGADVIIAALGARPVIPKIIGIENENVLGAEAVYYHPEKTGKTVIILGGGLVGLELGIYLAGLGRKIVILEMMETLNFGGNPIHGLALINEIKKFGIEVTTATQVVEINQKGVIGEYVGNAYTLLPCPTVQTAAIESNSVGRVVQAEEGGQKIFEADTIIYALGQQPLQAEADKLRFCAPEFHQIGDCLSPQNIAQATSMAFNIVRDI